MAAWLEERAVRLVVLAGYMHLLTSAFVKLTWLKVIPFWISAVVVSRDLVLSVGVLVGYGGPLPLASLD